MKDLKKWIFNIDHIACIQVYDDETARVTFRDASSALFDKDAAQQLLAYDFNYKNQTQKGQFIEITAGTIR